MNNKLSKKKCNEVVLKLEQMYPDAKPGLDYTNPFELLIATMLSAQCTDKQVNKITKNLFKTFKVPNDFLQLNEETLGKYIRSCGLYKTKSKHILETCKILIEQYNGSIPNKMEELIDLPGVGRKTANVVLSNAFNIPALAVDTHVFRVSNRIGLANANNVKLTEEQLMKNINKNKWTKTHHTLIYHGRAICKAKNPKCMECKINNICIKNNIE